MLRYRGSKMYSGSNACGKSTAPGRGITGSCFGKVTDEGMGGSVATRTYTHRAHWKIDVSPSDEIEQTRELYGRVGACGDLENICAMGFGSAGFGAQHAQRRRRFEIME